MFVAKWGKKLKDSHKKTPHFCVWVFVSDELIRTAKYIATPGKGILAADESTSTIGKRMTSINVENTEGTRQALREMLFTAPGTHQFLSGVLMYEETLYQKTLAGKPFVKVLEEGGVMTGIKVDTGTIELAGTNGETTTQGHDGLAGKVPFRIPFRNIIVGISFFLSTC
jgi:fructose-bisphosphate aldolase class I